MSGTATYEIAPIADRALELVRFLERVGGQQELSAKLRPLVESGDYATLISDILECGDGLFRGTDEGESWWWGELGQARPWLTRGGDGRGDGLQSGSNFGVSAATS